MGKIKLVCSIDSHYAPGSYRYVVRDGAFTVSEGVSSTPGFVKHDAGGYHTKEKFDSVYGAGNWEVSYDFDPDNKIPRAEMR